MSHTIRPACVADVPAMGQIINDCAEYGLMLHRSPAELYEGVRDFFVAEEAGRAVGVCGLKIIWADLAELYALAVSPAARGRGLGGELAAACVQEARRLGVRRVMSLTYEQRFFERLGFRVVDRQQLPLKVWSECLSCPKNQACDEIAMLLEHPDIAEPAAPQPSAPGPDEYIVPVTVGRAASPGSNPAGP